MYDAVVMSVIVGDQPWVPPFPPDLLYMESTRGVI